MKFYDLYQIIITKQITDTINIQGWETAFIVFPQSEVWRKLVVRCGEQWKPQYIKHFTLVGTTKCESLDEVFDAFNGHGEEFVKRDDSMQSASVGNIIHDIEEDKWYIVESVGFTEVEVV